MNFTSVAKNSFKNFMPCINSFLSKKKKNQNLNLSEAWAIVILNLIYDFMILTFHHVFECICDTTRSAQRRISEKAPKYCQMFAFFKLFASREFSDWLCIRILFIRYKILKNRCKRFFSGNVIISRMHSSLTVKHLCRI